MLFSKIIAAAAFVVTVTAFPLLGNGKQVSGVSAEQAVLAVAQKLQTTIAPAVADAIAIANAKGATVGSAAPPVTYIVSALDGATKSIKQIEKDTKLLARYTVRDDLAQLVNDLINTMFYLVAAMNGSDGKLNQLVPNIDQSLNFFLLGAQFVTNGGVFGIIDGVAALGQKDLAAIGLADVGNTLFGRV